MIVPVPPTIPPDPFIDPADAEVDICQSLKMIIL
jgi:hypothetical protein